jgi:hypothetical protein
VVDVHQRVEDVEDDRRLNVGTDVVGTEAGYLLVALESSHRAGWHDTVRKRSSADAERERWPWLTVTTPQW